MADPSLGGFINFIYTNMNVPTAVLQSNDPIINEAYNYSLNIVNINMLGLPQPIFPSPYPVPAFPTANPYPSIYAIAVYNLAGDYLVNYKIDDIGTPDIAGTNPPLKFWAYTRTIYKIDSFIPGVVASTSDNGSSTSLHVLEMFDRMNLMDLQTLKTPWGRRYMQLASQMGPNDWGIS
jgi:hypothetical protein